MFVEYRFIIQMYCVQKHLHVPYSIAIVYLYGKNIHSIFNATNTIVCLYL